jgi:hypothetical protein
MPHSDLLACQIFHQFAAASDETLPTRCRGVCIRPRSAVDGYLVWRIWHPYLATAENQILRQRAKRARPWPAVSGGTSRRPSEETAWCKQLL